MQSSETDMQLVADELFDFDFSSDFVSDWAIGAAEGEHLFNEILASTTFDHQHFQCYEDAARAVLKSVSKKNGSKLSSGKHHHPRRSAAMEMPVVKAHRKLPLLIFPSFDRCDSLLFFPSAMARYLNSDDMKAASKLASTHLKSDCKISIDFCPEQNLNVKGLMKLSSILNEMQPDRVLCVHSTKVVGNQIRASVFFKSTESKAVTDGVKRATKDPLFSSVFHLSRNDRLKQRIREMKDLSAEEEHRLCDLVDSDVDLLVYVHLYMNITFDDITKKVTAFDVGGMLTSMHAVQDGITVE